MTGVFDTHSHIQFGAFAEDRAAVIERAAEAGVATIVACGDDVPSTVAAFQLAEGFPVVLPTAGIHPHEAQNADAAVLGEIDSLAGDDACVAVGEIGLDFFREISPRASQKQVLERQLEIAVKRELPVVIHSRGAEDEIQHLLRPYAECAPLRKHDRPVGVMHCFGGTTEQAQLYAEMGFLISVPCTITYPKNEELRRLSATLPLDQLVVETDSPYLPPQPLRGKRNEPAHVVAAVSEIARVRGDSFETVAQATTHNARRLFGSVAKETAVSG